MVPVIQKINLAQLGLNTRKVCPCKTHCEEGITITFKNDGTILCWNDARKYLYKLIKVLDTEDQTTWAPKDEEFIIAKFKKDGMYRGFNREVAESLGKSYDQVKSKVRRMRDKGIF